MNNARSKEHILTKIEEERLHNINILKKIFEERYLEEDRINLIFKGIKEALNKKKDNFIARICISSYFSNGGLSGPWPLRTWDFVFDEEIKDYYTKRWFLNKRIYNKKKTGYEVLEYHQDLVRFNRSVDDVLERIITDSSSVKQVLNELQKNSFTAKVIKMDEWVYAISVSL
ncbi:hypothetical protein [Paenibacillus solani]|uniref:hypothetical protein n=1 Tax=Paenibacillus solani TaxID=1705565 RepID=UPI003D2B1266